MLLNSLISSCIILMSLKNCFSTWTKLYCQLHVLSFLDSIERWSLQWSLIGFKINLHGAEIVVIQTKPFDTRTLSSEFNSYIGELPRGNKVLRVRDRCESTRQMTWAAVCAEMGSVMFTCARYVTHEWIPLQLSICIMTRNNNMWKEQYGWSLVQRPEIRTRSWG